MTSVAEVRLWGRRVGAVALDKAEHVATFEFEASFRGSGIELSPLMMPSSLTRYRFPELSQTSFHGLPGLLADTLPEKFGNSLISAWLAGQGRSPDSLNAIERLCHTGARGMGALEFYPIDGPTSGSSGDLRLDALVDLASDVLADGAELSAALGDAHRTTAVQDILSVGTSAGGARAKAVITWNPETGAVGPGHAHAAPGFEHWLVKLDGVRGNGGEVRAEPAGLGAVEYAYHLMATEAGVEMMPCRLISDANGRQHFMTKRFDRLGDGEKLHLQSLSALLHLDLEQARTHSYEQALLAMKRLGLPHASGEQFFRRMVFNVLARNQDDHVKNTAFLMDPQGRWSLAPAFDVTYAHEPGAVWASAHRMSVNGKFDGISADDLRAVGRVAILKRGWADKVLNEVVAAVLRWPEHAEMAGVRPEVARKIGATFPLRLAGRSA